MSNSYPYPDLLPLLQINCTPDEYFRAKAGANPVHIQHNHLAYADYWRLVPEYTYAYCPFCLRRYREPADTFSLWGWIAERFLFPSLFMHGASSFFLSPSCPHLLGVHQFVNFHGIRPVEVDWFENKSGEVPYISPWFFSDDIATYVVLHALPICRIEDNQFVPRYTAFSLTYFSEQAHEVLERVYRSQMEIAARDREYYPATVAMPGSRFSCWRKDPKYQLEDWAARGQLGWLDVKEPDLPLRIGPGLQLPALYRNIPGRRRAHLWRRGHLRYTL